MQIIMILMMVILIVAIYLLYKEKEKLKQRVKVLEKSTVKKKVGKFSTEIILDNPISKGRIFYETYRSAKTFKFFADDKKIGEIENNK